MEPPFSLYAVLRVPPGASPAAVEAAYRSLMKRHHPDHAGSGSAAHAAEINAAFSVLRDPATRSAYDRAEHGRQCAMFAARANRLQRRHRRLVRGGAALSAALALGAAIPLGANWYGGGFVPPRAAAPAAAPAAQFAVAPDPIEHVADFLAKAAARRPIEGLRAPPKPQAAPEARPAAARASAERRLLMRRPAPPPRPRSRGSAGQSSEPDFLEREGFIY
jgi:curved DNA-binding protein CbpA